MLLDDLQMTFDTNKQYHPLYVRNLLKEQLQYYVVNFIYNSSYADHFLFTGGTCLRFCFDLPRLSEDLDFDVTEFRSFTHDRFVHDLKDYFKQTLRYPDVDIVMSGAHNLIYLRFPILDRLGFPTNPLKPTERILHVRIDLAPIGGTHYHKEVSLKSTYDFSFLIRRYSLPDLYANKLATIIQRQKTEGERRVPRFKGRDYFDIWWLHEKGVRWNTPYLQSLTGITSNEQLIVRINTKIKEAARRKQEIKQDLLPFFQNPHVVTDVVDHLDHLKLNPPKAG